MKLIIDPRSHMDHGLSTGHLLLIAEGLKQKEEGKLTILQLDIPKHLPKLPCKLRGPIVGMEPIGEGVVEWCQRGAREVLSRMVRHDVLESKMAEYYNPESVQTSAVLTAVIGPDGTLFTAYGGPLAPREPGDPSISEEDRLESAKFWSEHALVP